jgi:hypothetical protein
MSEINCEHGVPVLLETDRHVFDQTGVNLDCFVCEPTPESQALEHNVIEPKHETIFTATNWHCLDCDACIEEHGLPRITPSDEVGTPNIQGVLGRVTFPADECWGDLIEVPAAVVTTQACGIERATAAEFWADPAHKAIQVRSASRLGASDLGVNRARIERIRTATGPL